MTYSTITLKRVLESIQRARGFDPSSVTLTTAEQQQYTDIVNEAGKRAWRAEFWPCLMSVEQRQYRPTWDAGTTYAVGNEVYLNEVYYRSLAGGNVGNTPEAGSAFWEASPSDMVLYVAFEQWWETTPIEAVHFPDCAYLDDPLTTPAARVVTGVTQWERSILFASSPAAPARPYIRFRAPWPEQSAVAWNIATDYTVGERCYVASTGYTYVALQPNTGLAPESHATEWAPVGFPEMFLEYVRLYAKADLAADDEGKYKTRAQAEDEMDDLRDVHLPKSGQAGRVNWSSR